MKVYVSTAFIYSILGGILSVLLYVYYQKSTSEDYQKSKSIYNIGIFVLFANIIYFSTQKNVGIKDVEFQRIFENPYCEMKTGQPNF